MCPCLVWWIGLRRFFFWNLRSSPSLALPVHLTSQVAGAGLSSTDRSSFLLSPTVEALFALGSLGHPVTEVYTGTPSLNLLKLSGQVGRADVEARLESELEPKHDDETERLLDFEKALQTTYNSLPKNEEGHISHQAVRYVLHRVFAQRRGWFIRGLEPNSRSPSAMSNLQEEWVPSYLQALLEREEKELGEKGTSLKELAALAAAIEDLAAGESGARLKASSDCPSLCLSIRRCMGLLVRLCVRPRVGPRVLPSGLCACFLPPARPPVNELEEHT